MPLVSNYANGTFFDGRWFCGCGSETLWLTSKQEGSMGEKFTACPKPRGQQCGFFLIAEDDATARVEKASNTPPAPRTPTGKQLGGMLQSLPTPDTGMSSSRGLFADDSSRRGRIQGLNDSPTPNRFRVDGKEDLPSLILGLLRKDGIVLKGSTESAIRHMIMDRLRGYEAKLQNSAESLQMAFEKLDELEEGRQG